jgi:hypothetical protein
VDVLNQNRSGKRKRGKLNLEKAMAKNIFDEPPDPKRMNIFDSLKIANSTKITSNTSDTDSNFNKNSKRSHTSNGKEQQTGDFILREVHETDGKTKHHHPSHHHHHHKGHISNGSERSGHGSASSSPTMYKIAMRLKKLTELRIRKTHSDGSGTASALYTDNNNNKPPLPPNTSTATVAAMTTAAASSSSGEEKKVQLAQNEDSQIEAEIKKTTENLNEFDARMMKSEINMDTSVIEAIGKI